jgi:hypothetical protein
VPDGIVALRVGEHGSECVLARVAAPDVSRGVDRVRIEISQSRQRRSPIAKE